MEKQNQKSNGYCGIRDIMAVTGICMKSILSSITCGAICAERKGAHYVFKVEEKERLKKLNSGYIGCWRMVSDILAKNSAFSMKNKACRGHFYEFMETNNWFEIQKLVSSEVFFAETKGEDLFLLKSDVEKITARLILWLSSYKMCDEEKQTLLMNILKSIYPITAKQISLFLKKHPGTSKTVIWKLLDYLCVSLSCELTEISEKMLSELIAEMDRVLPLNAAGLFEKLLCFIRKNGAMPNGWTYHFNSRCQKESNDAYPAVDFLKMAYTIFNEESWKREHLLQKALGSEKCSNLWLFTALHFICGWRASDLVRLPLPKLPYDGQTVRKFLGNHDFDVEGMVSELEYRLNFTPMKPNKTSNTSEVPDLKLFVPESLRKPMGIILAVAASFHDGKKPGTAFIHKSNNLNNIENFFGINFAQACGKRNFNTRRANKSYLQGIESSSDNNHGGPKGYMLAALARSHKGGYGTLPKTTEIYLRDAKFSGYSTTFIARQMFERGVFSFIPALLLDMYAGEIYTNLPIAFQTKAIAEIGISVSGLEHVAKLVNTALAKARNAILEIMRHPEDIRGTVLDILQAIASGSAPGRQDGMLCLMTASGFICPYAERTCCIGCGYEIYTKTILHNLAEEYTRLLKRKKETDEIEAVRCGNILKEAIIPAITEILHSVKLLYPQADLKLLLNTVERSLRYADNAR